MKAVTLLALLLAVFLASGCSLFGVATKGDINDLERAQTAQRDQMRQELGNARTQLDEINRELDNLQTASDQRIATLEQNSVDMTELLASLNTRIQETSAIVAELEGGIRGDLDSLQVGLAQTSSTATAAHLHSQKAVQALLNDLVAEREALAARLANLDEQLRAWEELDLMTTGTLEITPTEPQAASIPLP